VTSCISHSSLCLLRELGFHPHARRAALYAADQHAVALAAAMLDCSHHIVFGQLPNGLRSAHASNVPKTVPLPPPGRPAALLLAPLAFAQSATLVEFGN
jgi:hypothetical protein